MTPPIGTNRIKKIKANAFYGEPIVRENPIVWSVPTHEYEFVPPMTLREDNYLLVGFFNDKQADQLWMEWIKTAQPQEYALYDLSQDIGQTTDLKALKPDVVARLSDKMKEMFNSFNEVEKAIELGDDDGESFFHLGFAYYALENCDKRFALSLLKKYWLSSAESVNKSENSFS